MIDKEIIGLYFDRDEAAIEKTAEKYERYLLTVAENILHNEPDAKECVNDTYKKAWDTIPPARPERLSSYLGKLTRNLAFDRYRSAHAGKRGGGEIAAVLDELNECVSSSESVESRVEEAELIGEINAFLAGLPKERSRLFVLRYWYVLPTAEIAKRTGLTAGNVATRLSRIRGELKEYLIKRGYEI